MQACCAAASGAAWVRGAPGQAGVELAGVAIGSHAQQGGWCLAAAAACCAAPPISWHGPPPHVSAPQVLWATFRPASASLLPGQLTLAAGCAVLAAETAGRLPERLRGAWAATSAWTATALFMLQPVSQLVLNFTDPASLQVSMSGSILCPGLHARRCASRGCEVHCVFTLTACCTQRSDPDGLLPCSPRCQPHRRACPWPPSCWRRRATR